MEHVEMDHPDAQDSHAQTRKEDLALFWDFKHQQKYMSCVHFAILTDHETRRVTYIPQKTLAKSSAAAMQRWIFALAVYLMINYTTVPMLTLCLDLPHRLNQTMPTAYLLHSLSLPKSKFSQR